MCLGFSFSSLGQTTLDPRPWSEVFPNRPTSPSSPVKPTKPTPTPLITLTPKPVNVDWQAEAIRKYPELAIKDSALNKRFVEAFIERSKNSSDFFRDTRWPLILADEIASPPVNVSEKNTISPPLPKNVHNQSAKEQDTFLANYQIDLQKLIRDVQLGEITDLRQADELMANCNALVVTMTEHSKLIITKWAQITSLLSDSGLNDRGLQKVFLKQFTEEEALNNLRILTACRKTKDELLAKRVSGCERTQAALQSLFSAYANLCERDRKPTDEPADFLREIRHRFDSLAANIFVYSEEIKALKARLHPVK